MILDIFTIYFKIVFIINNLIEKDYKVKIFRCEVISMYVEIDTFFGLSQVAITSKFEDFSIFCSEFNFKKY